MNKKEAVTTFFKMIVADQVEQAYEKFVAPGFIHHNQWYKGDRQSLLNGMAENNKVMPNKNFAVKRVFEDGDTVITHSHMIPKPGELGAAVVHIFRFEGDKVVELWDLGMPLIKDSPNENGPF
jgi:predicted SnoaL-like aldol condensation-catalyzing enzyme